jgi:O-antigen ligase
MIIVAAIILLSVHGVTYITKTTLKIIGAFTLAILVLYIYLFSVKIERRNSGLDAFLFKIKNAPAELFTTRIDRENHKDLWDHWRGYEAKRAFALMKEHPSSYLVGTGQGSLVNLKFEAPLTGEKDNGLKFISELHNGYVYIFYKTGIIGLLILLYFLISFYKKIYQRENENQFATILVSSIGILFLFTTLTITGIYNAKDVIIFILGALLYYYKENDQKAIN